MPRQLTFQAGFWPNLHAAVEKHAVGQEREQLLVALTNALADLCSLKIYRIKKDFARFPHDPDDVNRRWVALSPAGVPAAHVTFTFEGAPKNAQVRSIAGYRIVVRAFGFGASPSPV